MQILSRALCKTFMLTTSASPPAYPPHTHLSEVAGLERNEAHVSLRGDGVCAHARARHLGWVDWWWGGNPQGKCECVEGCKAVER